MIITLRDGLSFDTDRDLTAAERHVLQKLMIWQVMAASLEEFQKEKARALQTGWNNSGRVKESQALRLIIQDLERELTARLAHR